MDYHFAEADENGRITKWWSVPIEDYPEGVAVHRQPDVNADYMDGDVLRKRPRMEIAAEDGVLTGVPKGAAVRIEDQEFTADGGEIEIEGYHGEVCISLWPYMDEVVTL